MKKSLFYRISQLVGFVLGARVFVTLLLVFALYVSAFFLFNQDESLHRFVFDYRVHIIIFCSLFSILAGGIINQFYDREKDQITKPFRTKIQSFLKQKYFLFAYLFLNIFSLGLAALVSFWVFSFFLFYQFLMWFYSHKLSKILFLNNISFVLITLYPFFGILVYYKTFSVDIMFLAAYLFLILLIIDIIKDTLTKKADTLFGYQTISNVFGHQKANLVAQMLLVMNFTIAMLVCYQSHFLNVWIYYFMASLLVFIFSIFFLFTYKNRTNYYLMNVLRLWIFIGILAMMLNGILQ